MPELFGSVYILPAVVVVVLLLVLLLLVMMRRRKAAEAVKPKAQEAPRRARSATELGATLGVELPTNEPSEQVATAAGAVDVAAPVDTPAPPEPARRSSAPTDVIKDPLQLVILDILRIPGAITEDDTRRLTLFRPDKVLEATQSLELPKDLRSDDNARGRLMQLRQYATNAVEKMAAVEQPTTIPAGGTEGFLPTEEVPQPAAAAYGEPTVPEQPQAPEETESIFQQVPKSAFASAYGPAPTDAEDTDGFTATYETAVTAEAIEAVGEVAALDAPRLEQVPVEQVPLEQVLAEQVPIEEAIGAAGSEWSPVPGPTETTDAPEATHAPWLDDVQESSAGETIVVGEGVFLEDAARSEDELPPSGEELDAWAQWQDLDPLAQPAPTETTEPQHRETADTDLAGGEQRVEMVEEYLVESASEAATEAEPPFSFDEPTSSSPGLTARSIRRADDLMALPEEERREIVAFLDPVELSKVFDRTDDPELKKAIIDTLEQGNDPASLSVLRLCLDDDDPEVLMYALEAAERILGDD